MKYYDLRSDTITKPSLKMRKAMYQAEVGDDVYNEDPTVNRLQEMAASITGKEKALFISSGSMGNLISLYLNCGRQNEVLCSSLAHIIHHEIASCAAIAGVLPIGIECKNGILHVSDFKDKIKPNCYDMAQTTMIEVENTIGGYPYSLENTKAIYAFAKENHLKVHMDGARIFNASLAENVSVSEYGKCTDSLTFCLSKGLGAPVGSMLCGDNQFIEKAKTIRKLLGGGLRQSGIIAAAGIYALENNIERLQDDHENAQKIASALAENPFVKIEMENVKTNIVFFTVPGFNNSLIIEKLKQVGILCNEDSSQIRLVTNLDLSNEDIPAIEDILINFKLK